MIEKVEKAVNLIERLAAIHKEIIMIIMTLALCAPILCKLWYGG